MSRVGAMWVRRFRSHRRQCFNTLTTWSVPMSSSEQLPAGGCLRWYRHDRSARRQRPHRDARYSLLVGSDTVGTRFWCRCSPPRQQRLCCLPVGVVLPGERVHTP